MLIKEFIEFANAHGPEGSVYADFKDFKENRGTRLLEGLGKGGADTDLIRKLRLDTVPALEKLAVMQEEGIDVNGVLAALEIDGEALAAFNDYAENNGSVSDLDNPSGRTHAFAEFCNTSTYVSRTAVRFLFADEVARAEKAKAKIETCPNEDLEGTILDLFSEWGVLSSFETHSGFPISRDRVRSVGPRAWRLSDKPKLRLSAGKFLESYLAHIGTLKKLALRAEILPWDLKIAGLADNPVFTQNLEQDFASVAAFGQIVSAGGYDSGLARTILGKFSDRCFADRFKREAWNAAKGRPSAMFEAVLEGSLDVSILCLKDDPETIYGKLKDEIGISDSEINELVEGELAEDEA